MRFAVIGLCLMLLAGCVTARNTNSATDSEGRRAFLHYAGGASPVYLVAGNPPGALGDPRRVAAHLAEAASGAVFAMDTAFTADLNAATRPNFRLVALFDPTVSLSMAELCAAEADPSLNPPVAARHADRTTLFLAFCTRGTEIAGTIVTGPKITTLKDPALREMVRAGIRQMFSGDDRRRERGKPPILGSISLVPSPGFRFNPLTGVFE